MKWYALLFSIVFFLGGCAVGNQYDYRQSNMVMPVKGDAFIGLLVNDLRPYVLNGDKQPNFIGLQRGGFGNPFDVTTVSGAPLANDFEEVLAASLRKNGYKVGLVDQKTNPTPESVKTIAGQSGFAKVLALLVRDWKTDIMMTMTLHYDLEAIIYGADGAVLASNKMKAVEEVGGAGLGEEKNSLTAQEVFAQKISYLFYTPEIKKALGN